MTEDDTETAVVSVSGMTNGRCASSVRSALSLIGGVKAVEISLESGRATVHYDAEKVDPSQFRVAVRAVGFDAVPLAGGPG